MDNTPNTPTRRNASVCGVCGSHGHNCRTCPSGLFNDVLNSVIINADKYISRVPEIEPIVACQYLYKWLEDNDKSFSLCYRGAGDCYITGAMSILATRLRITTSITNPDRIRLLCEYLFTTRTIEKNASAVFTEYTPREHTFRNRLGYQTDIAVSRLRENARVQEHITRLRETERERAQQQAVRDRQRHDDETRRQQERLRQRTRAREEIRQDNDRRTLVRLNTNLRVYFDNLPTHHARCVFVERIRHTRDTNPGFATDVYSRFIIYASTVISNNMINSPISPRRTEEYFDLLSTLRRQQALPQVLQPHQRALQPHHRVPDIATRVSGIIVERECPVCYENKLSQEFVIYDCGHGLCVSCYDSYLSHLLGRRATCAMCRTPLHRVYREEAV